MLESIKPEIMDALWIAPSKKLSSELKHAAQLHFCKAFTWVLRTKIEDPCNRLVWDQLERALRGSLLDHEES